MVSERKCQMTDGEDELMEGPLVGQDSNLVLEDTINNQIGMLSHEEMEATARTGQAECDEPGESGNGQEPKKAQNKANLIS